jgi:hypothetical protein
MRILLPCLRHELHAFICDAALPATYSSYTVPIAKTSACAILAEFNKAQTDLMGKAVILTDGKAGTVDDVWLDEFHGLRISIEGHEGKWPVSTIKFAQIN